MSYEYGSKAAARCLVVNRSGGIRGKSTWTARAGTHRSTPIAIYSRSRGKGGLMRTKTIRIPVKTKIRVRTNGITKTRTSTHRVPIKIRVK